MNGHEEEIGTSEHLRRRKVERTGAVYLGEEKLQGNLTSTCILIPDGSAYRR